MSGIHFIIFLVLFFSIHQSSEACLVTLNELAQTEAEINDWSVLRTYTLCPNTRFVVGRYDYSNHLVDGQDPLVVRPNLHVKCGDDGSHTNKCLVVTGDILVTDSPTTVSLTATPPIVLEGLTLVDPGRHFVKFTQPYDVRFVDCEFRDATRAKVPLLLDFYNPLSSTQESLSVYWHGCSFVNNVYRGTAAQPSLIVGTNHQVALSLQGCQFTNNDLVTDNVVADRNSFLIDTSGPLKLVRNCFSWNAVGVSPAVSYHAGENAVAVEANFAEVSRGNVCPFVSHFRTAWQYKTDSPYCYDFDASTCQVEATGEYWMIDPTRFPTPGPRDVPTVNEPTSLPSHLIKTPAPTRTSNIGTPTKSPTTKPLSLNPTLQPTIVSKGSTDTQAKSSSVNLFFSFWLVLLSLCIAMKFCC